MKKIILLALLAIGLAPAYAQTSVGIIGGYNLNFMYPVTNLESSGYKVSYGSGWRAGLIADKHLWKNFYLQPQLIFNQKGYNYSYDAGAPSYAHTDMKRRLLYLELQAHLLFKPKIGNSRLFVGIGPYIARGISGRERMDGYYLDQDGQQFNFLDYNIIRYKKDRPKSDLYYSEGNVSYVKPYDIGVNVLGGYELKNGLYFNITYSLGVNNVGHNPTNFIGNGYLGVTVGYFLKRFS